MSSVEVKFTVSPGSGVRAFWLAVSQNDVIDEPRAVPLQNATGTADIKKGNTHMVTWFLEGNPGASMSISGVTGAGTASEKEVFSVKKTRIPSTRAEGAGAKELLIN